MRAAASAALLALAQPMADGWPRWTGILGLVALVPMLTLPPQPRLRRALSWLLCGYLYGFVLVHWMWVVHWLALLLLPLLFGTSFAAFGLLDGFCRGQRERLWLGAAAWAALELLRSVGPFSFCWGLLGYGPERAGMLSVVAAMLGPYAAGYVVFLINMSVIGVIRAGSSSLRRRWIASLCVLLVFGFLSTPPAPQASPKLRALLVQGAHPQAVKWKPPTSSWLTTCASPTRRLRPCRRRRT
ncbi:hypothetical protein HS125_06035 [bacterium]|nr:hypothetical protein [bacterium]